MCVVCCVAALPCTAIRLVVPLSRFVCPVCVCVVRVCMFVPVVDLLYQARPAHLLLVRVLIEALFWEDVDSAGGGAHGYVFSLLAMSLQNVLVMANAGESSAGVCPCNCRVVL